MRVELGNIAPKTVAFDGDQRVTYIEVPDDYTYVVAEPGAVMRIGRDNDVEVESAADLATQALVHIARQSGGMSHIPDQEALLAVRGAWEAHSDAPPAWVWSDNEPFMVLLGAFFDCPIGRPDGVEFTHHTAAGPPGVLPRDAEVDAEISTANAPSEEA
jgi:hypothetical protein